MRCHFSRPLVVSADCFHYLQWCWDQQSCIVCSHTSYCIHLFVVVQTLWVTQTCKFMWQLDWLWDWVMCDTNRWSRAMGRQKPQLPSLWLFQVTRCQVSHRNNWLSSPLFQVTRCQVSHRNDWLSSLLFFYQLIEYCNYVCVLCHSHWHDVLCTFSNWHDTLEQTSITRCW